MGKSRICWRCHHAGIMIHFATKREYKIHVKTRHSGKPKAAGVSKKEISKHRRQVILFRAKYGVKNYPL